MSLAVAVILIIAGLGNLARKVFESVPSDGASWSETSGGLVARAGGDALLPGDRLLAIDGVPIRGRYDKLLVDRSSAAGVTRLYALERHGEPLTASVQLVDGRPSRSYLFLALVGFASLLAAIRILLSGRSVPGRDPAAAAALAFGAIALLSPVGWLDLADRCAILGEDLARCVFPALILHATLAYLRGPLTRTARFFLYAPSVLLAVGEVMYLSSGRWLQPPTIMALGTTLSRLQQGHMVAFIALAAVVTLRQTRRAWNRSTTRWWALALAFGVGPYLALVAIPSALGLYSPALADLAILALMILPLALVSTFGDEARGWSRTLRYEFSVAMGMLLGGGLALATAAVLASVLAEFAAPAWLGYASVAVVLAIGIQDRWRGLARSWVEALVDRQGFEARRTLVEFGRDLAVESNLMALSIALLDRLSRAFCVERAAIYIADADGELRLVRAQGSNLDLSDCLPPGLVALKANGEPEAGSLPEGFDLLTPLQSRGRVVGAVLLGGSRRGYGTRRDRALLADVAAYAAIAVDNAALLGETQAQASAIHELEQFRASVVESLPVGVLIVDLGGKILSANRALRDIIGVSAVAAENLMIEALPAAILDPPSEGEVIQRSLGNRVVCLSSSLLRRADASIQGRIIVVEDVTERVAEEKERARREKLASVGMLSAGIAHEVNTPLTGIASYVQMLLEAVPADARFRPLLEKIEQQSFRAARLVRNLLNFARPKEDGVAPFSVNSVLQQAASLLEHQARNSRVEIIFDLASGDPSILGRESEIEQVAVNLVKNALDAMPRGGRLHLASSCVGDRVAFAVEDTGCGMNEEIVDRIYDPFFTTKVRGSGHGLGLAVAYGIVRTHGGDIAVESTVGRGTRFEVSVPAVAGRVEASGARQ